MNAEKAVEVLRGNFLNIKLSENETHSDVFAQAFDMAIKAIETEARAKQQTIVVESLFDQLIVELSELRNAAYDQGHTVSGATYKDAIRVVKKYRKECSVKRGGVND